MNFYKILEIDDTADSKDIKRAYAKMVRRFPPETHAEEYNKIREAYEVLSNPGKKAEYDAHNKYSEEIEKCLTSAKISLEESDFSAAIKDYKKILLLEPKLSYVKNYLALAYGYNEQYDDCIKIFKELIESYPDIAHYHYNIAHAYGFKEDNNLAISHLFKALELDPNYEEAASKLIDLYLKLNKDEDAIKFLRSKAKSLNDLFYFLELLTLYTKKNDYAMLESLVKEIFNLIPPNDTAEKEQISYEIGKFAFDLKGPFTLKASIVILESFISIYPDDEDAQNLLKSRKQRESLADLYIEFSKDTKYEDSFVRYIYMNVNSPDFSDEEYKKLITDVLKDIEYTCRNNSQELITMLTGLKKEYPPLYNLQNEYFDDLIKVALLWRNRNKNINTIKKDIDIPKPLTELIDLWLTDDISDEERDKRFMNITENIKRTNRYFLLKGLNKIKNNYTEFYSLNDEYINDLIKANDYDGVNINKTINKNNQRKQIFGNKYIYFIILFIIIQILKYIFRH